MTNALRDFEFVSRMYSRVYSKTSHTGFRWTCDYLGGAFYIRRILPASASQSIVESVLSLPWCTLSLMAPLSRVLISTQTCIINGLGAGYGQCSNDLEVLVICKVFLVVNIYLRYFDNIRFQTLNIGNIIVSLLNTLQPSHL